MPPLSLFIIHYSPFMTANISHRTPMPSSFIVRNRNCHWSFTAIIIHLFHYHYYLTTQQPRFKLCHVSVVTDGSGEQQWQYALVWFSTYEKLWDWSCIFSAVFVVCLLQKLWTSKWVCTTSTFSAVVCDMEKTPHNSTNILKEKNSGI